MAAQHTELNPGEKNWKMEEEKKNVPTGNWTENAMLPSDVNSRSDDGLDWFQTGDLKQKDSVSK